MSWLEGDAACESWSVVNPGFDFGMKDFGEFAGVCALTDEWAPGIEETGLGKEGLCFFGLAKETGLTGLLYQVGDVALMGECKGLGVVGVRGIELHGLAELSFGTC
jgi:hypothetical protein